MKEIQALLARLSLGFPNIWQTEVIESTRSQQL